jgi:7-carboxy-7-deazaguanine synthase
MALWVNEIFYSIQGESSYSGYPCVFVRLTGCNLRCTYCDTHYAYHEGQQLEVIDILQIIESYQCPLVEITGGEPLIHADTPGLIKILLDKGFKVLLETNGSQDISQIDNRCVKIVDIKCPGSGEVDQNDLSNLFRLTGSDELKFVIGSREDYEFAKKIIRLEKSAPYNPKQINFSPVFGILEPKRLAEWILEDRLQVRLNLQLQKIIWTPEERGV